VAFLDYIVAARAPHGKRWSDNVLHVIAGFIPAFLLWEAYHSHAATALLLLSFASQLLLCNSGFSFFRRSNKRCVSANRRKAPRDGRKHN